METPDVQETFRSVAVQAIAEAWKLDIVRLATGVVGCVLLVKLCYALYRWRRWAAAGIVQIDAMSGLEFEQYLESLFRRLGYRVERTRYSGDFGADLVLCGRDERRVVQAKRKAGRVGVAAIQQAVAARAMYECDAAMVVTNSSFTAQADALADANDVELWDRERLVAEILRVGLTRLPYLQEKVTHEENAALPPLPRGRSPRTDSETPALIPIACRACGREVPEAVREQCLTDMGRFGGYVYCQAHQRRASTARARTEGGTPRRRSKS